VFPPGAPATTAERKDYSWGPLCFAADLNLSLELSFLPPSFLSCCFPPFVPASDLRGHAGRSNAPIRHANLRHTRHKSPASFRSIAPPRLTNTRSTQPLQRSICDPRLAAHSHLDRMGGAERQAMLVATGLRQPKKTRLRRAWRKSTVPGLRAPWFLGYLCEG